MALELVPIGALAALITQKVLKTAQAANDVVIEKESFKALSKHLFDLEIVLQELQLKKLDDTQAVRKALESLEADVKKANNLVEKYKNRARFYLLVNCRHIVEQVQDVTRDIGKSLAALPLATTDVLLGISDQVNRLQNEMQRVEFEASQSQLEIVDKLNQGLIEQKLDQDFANRMLEDIARAVGVPVEPSKISEELANFRREKEEAANRKERNEAVFLEQIIELLSRADAAKDHEEIKKQYSLRIQVIERYNPRAEYIPHLGPFTCPINGTVMVDPVSLCTGTTCERTAIEAWFDSGLKTDPDTGELLEDFSVRSNLPLRKSIEEWRELNYCLKIRTAKMKLLSGEASSIEEALDQMVQLIGENSINKDWVTLGDLTDITTSILGSSRDREVKTKILVTLKVVVEGHQRNKEEVLKSHGLDHIIPCLGRDSNVSKAAVELLYELLQDGSGSNKSLCTELSQKNSAIIFLVTLLKGTVKEAAEKAEVILLRLCDEVEENIFSAARAGWYKPLIDRIVQGPEPSRISIVRGLVNMELVDQNIKILGEEGIIPPLLELLSGDIESKEVSLSALIKLLNLDSNKELFATAGGVPLVLNLLFTSRARTTLKAQCCQILERLSSNSDGIKFLVDETGSSLELKPIITNLLGFQQNPKPSHRVLRPALHALLSICKFEEGLVKTAVLAAGGVSLVLPLLDDPDQEIREIAINIIFLFSQHEPQGIVEYLLMPRRLEALVMFLEKDDKEDMQIAAAGLLANLPKSEVLLTMKLIELDAVKLIINILRSGTVPAQENALSALFRFTDPTDTESQRIVVELEAYPLLVNLLRFGSETAKARAAALIGNLSSSSPKLAVMPKPVGCWCLRSKRVPLCSAHGAICSVPLTFCLLEAGALPELVKLLKEKVVATSYEAIQTLSTLVREDSPQRGANVLHEADAVNMILEVLNWGPDSLKEEALGLLEKVFVSREMVDLYGSKARSLLIGITGGSIRDDGNLRGKAAKVVSLIERYSRPSTSLVPALFG